MKKLTALLLSAVLLLLLCACASKGGPSDRADAEREVPQTEEPAAADVPPETPAPAAEAVSFVTTDIYGDPVDSSLLNGSRLVLLNLWEPWCGPCVREMPDLQALYEAYKDQGLLIVGVYSTFSQDREALAIVEEVGITYPVLRCSNELAKLQQSYVPATYLLDGNGNLLISQPVIGAQSYAVWEELILAGLNAEGTP